MANGISNAPTKVAVGPNGLAGYGHETRPAPPPPATAAAKNGKGKQKKAETDQELLLRKISELEQSKKGEKGETEELGGCKSRSRTAWQASGRPETITKTPCRLPWCLVALECRFTTWGQEPDAMPS